ncbi:DUF4202 family protein [Mucilaginibacter xinganensis]|uniref:Uncharacterized protein n=1 Tax=Mucilaginibacter xinganensis TaxID=1234841 RepID=A0A223NWK8_9SPHI|nr:DUF4202 family protein [Mucilaginibacter xinganensis]ASU34170.1 hypothetical protein MuYL_2281 [Mucilaginibacter xinganensis]
MNKPDSAFELFDAYNKQDPRSLALDGVSEPQEYFFAVKLYKWILKLNPGASEELLLASRSQHIGRWEISFEAYPAFQRIRVKPTRQWSICLQVLRKKKVQRPHK